MSEQQQLDRGEEQRRSFVFKEFGAGCYNRSSRWTVPEQFLYYCENAMPISDGNGLVVPNIGGSLINYGADPIYWSQYINLSGTDYLINLSTTGKVFAYNISAKTSSQINAGTLLAGSSGRLAQWKRQVVLFVDSAGYYYWDGTTFAKLTGTSVPTNGDDIAVAFNRVWILQGRLLLFSGVDGFGGGTPVIPDGVNYWTVANGTGTINLTDPTIKSTITRLWSQNGYLYLIGGANINAISDVIIPTGASPPTPVFTNQNIQSLIGTDQPGSVIAFDRLTMFANRYGVYALLGLSAERLSANIDGTWQYVDFNQVVSGGAVVINNILCAAFLIKRQADPTFGSNTVLTMWFDNKWWFANFGALTFVAPAIKSNTPVLYGFIGNKLYQLFADTSTAPAVKIMTRLADMQDPFADKQSIRAGFEINTVSTPGTYTLTVDSPTASNSMTVSTNTSSGLWINAAGTTGQWKNAAGTLGDWAPPAYQLYTGAAPYTPGKFIGFTLTSTGAVYQLAAFYLDFKLRARWQ